MLRRRRKSEPPKENEDTVQIADEHAWWANRDEFDSNKVPTGKSKQKPEEEPKRSTFEEYFSTESLFNWTGGSDSIFDETDPYVVLGIPPSATWEEISSAHRRLAKVHHPDRLQNVTDAEREASNRRIRDLNIAYMELRRRKGR